MSTFPAVKADTQPGGQIGVAILGGGFMANVHSRGARAAGARILGVMGADAADTARAQHTLGITRGYADLDQVLADPAVDLVHVCTPNAFHYEQALAVLEAGKAVICEKPLATTATAARTLAETASARGLIATVPFAYRFFPMVREARARIRSGEAGRITTIIGTYLQDWLLTAQDDNWRVSAKTGGASRAFGDIGSHLVDLLEFVTGDSITRVASRKRTVFDERAATGPVDTEDAVAVAAEFAGGALATLLVSQVAPGYKNQLRFEISGTAESLAFAQESPETLRLGRRQSVETLTRDPAFLSPDAARLCRTPAGHPQGYQDAFNAFIADTYAAVITGTEPEGLPTFADGLRAAVLTETVMAAAASDHWVDVPILHPAVPAPRPLNVNAR